MRELRNQRNWISDTEQALANQKVASEDEDLLKAQVDDQKVWLKYVYRYCTKTT